MKNRRFVLFLAAVMLLSLAACGGTPETPAPSTDVPTEMETLPAATDAATTPDVPSVAGEYTYEESLPFGTVPWILTLAEDGSYSLGVSKPNGQSYTYTGAYTVDGSVVITGTPAESTADIEAGFFNADFSCPWQLNDDGTMAPVNEDSGGGLMGGPPEGMDFRGDGDFKPANGGVGGGMPGGMPGMPGMPGMGGFAFDADYENVSYASASASQIMDVYLPETATGSDPVIIVVHGGGFQFGNQTMAIIEPIVAAGVKSGYVVASVDYRKSGEATFPGALSDVKAAVRYLRANASAYGIDAEKIVVWGESAGAYLADMTALTSGIAELDGDVSDNAGVSSAVSAMVSFYAPIEFYTMDEEFIALGNTASANHSVGSFETDYLGIQDMRTDREGVYQSWWGTYREQVPAELNVWIQAGTADTNVPYTQSQNLASGLTEILGAEHVQFGLIAGAAHEDDAFYTEENLAQIFAFLSDALK